MGVKLTGKEKTWASRWRRRHGFIRGNMPIRPGLSDEAKLGKAVASWRWFNARAASLPSGRELASMNMDETSVQFWHGHLKGNAPSRRRVRVLKMRPPVARASLNERRLTMTHVALVCDCPDLQSQLPQWLLANGAGNLCR